MFPDGAFAMNSPFTFTWIVRLPPASSIGFSNVTSIIAVDEPRIRLWPLGDELAAPPDHGLRRGLAADIHHQRAAPGGEAAGARPLHLARAGAQAAGERAVGLQHAAGEGQVAAAGQRRAVDRPQNAGADGRRAAVRVAVAEDPQAGAGLGDRQRSAVGVVFQQQVDLVVAQGIALQGQRSGPVPAKAMAPVLLNTSAALFWAPAALYKLFPYEPEESMVPLPARVNRRSMETDGVWVV